MTESEYDVARKILREDCEKMVESGELTQEEADFCYWMEQDDLLWFNCEE